MDGHHPEAGFIDAKPPAHSALFDNEPDDIFAQLKERFTASRNDIARLQSRVLTLEHENAHLKAEVAALSVFKSANVELGLLKRENEVLKQQLEDREADLRDTEALLCALTANKRQTKENIVTPTKPLTPLTSSSKRARSQSTETHEADLPAPKKSKLDSTAASTRSDTDEKIDYLSEAVKIYDHGQSEEPRPARLVSSTSPSSTKRAFLSGQEQDSPPAKRPRNHGNEDTATFVDQKKGVSVPAGQTSPSISSITPTPTVFPAVPSADGPSNSCSVSSLPSHAAPPPPAVMHWVFPTLIATSAPTSQPSALDEDISSCFSANSTSSSIVEVKASPAGGKKSTSTAESTSPLSSPPGKNSEGKEKERQVSQESLPANTVQPKQSDQCRPQPQNASKSAAPVPSVPSPPSTAAAAASPYTGVASSQPLQQNVDQSAAQTSSVSVPPSGGAAAAAPPPSSAIVASPSSSPTVSSAAKVLQAQATTAASASATFAGSEPSTSQPRASSSSTSAMQVVKQLASSTPGSTPSSIVTASPRAPAVTSTAAPSITAPSATQPCASSSMSAMEVDKRPVGPALAPSSLSGLPLPASASPEVPSTPKIRQPRAKAASSATAAPAPIVPSSAQYYSSSSTSAMQVDKQAVRSDFSPSSSSEPPPSSKAPSAPKTLKRRAAAASLGSAPTPVVPSAAQSCSSSSTSAMQVDKQAVGTDSAPTPSSVQPASSKAPSASKVPKPQAGAASSGFAALAAVVPSGVQSCSPLSTSSTQVDKQAVKSSSAPTPLSAPTPPPSSSSKVPPTHEISKPQATAAPSTSPPLAPVVLSSASPWTSAMQVDKPATDLPAPSSNVASISSTGSFVSGTLQLKASDGATDSSGTLSPPQSRSSQANIVVKIEQDVAVVSLNSRPKQHSSTRPVNVNVNPIASHAAPSAGPPSPVVQAILNSISQTQRVPPVSNVDISNGTAPMPASAIPSASAPTPVPNAGVLSREVGLVPPPLPAVAAAVLGSSSPSGHPQMQIQSPRPTIQVKQEPTSPSIPRSSPTVAAAVTATPALTAPKLSASPSTSSNPHPPAPAGNSNVAPQNMGSVSMTISKSASSSPAPLQSQAQAQSKGPAVQILQNQANASACKSLPAAAATAPTSTVSTTPAAQTNLTTAPLTAGPVPAPSPLASPSLSQASGSSPGNSQAHAKAHSRGTVSQASQGGKAAASANQAQLKAPAQATVTVTATATASSVLEQKKQSTSSVSSATPTPLTSTAAVTGANVNVTSQDEGSISFADLLAAFLQANPLPQQSQIRAKAQEGKTTASAFEAKGPTAVAVNSSTSMSDHMKEAVVSSKLVAAQTRPPENYAAMSSGGATSCSTMSTSAASSTAGTATLAASQLQLGSNVASVGNKPSQHAILPSPSMVGDLVPLANILSVKTPIRNASRVTAHAQTFIGRSQSTRPSTSPFKRTAPASASAVLILPSVNPSFLTDMKKHYLGASGPLIISPPPHDLQVPRTFLRLAYGGSDQQWVQVIPPDRNPSGPVPRRLVFPKIELNPAMPTSPGEPGLIFSSRHDILSDPPWSVFHRVSPTSKRKGPVVWKYLGDYECVLCGQMSAEAFQMLTDEVQRHWAQALLDTKRFEVYVAMRARIALRLAGLIPVKDDMDGKAGEEFVKDEIKAVQRGNGRSVREEDIIAAFSRGDEAIDIIRLICVKYDHVYADHMEDKYATYPAMLAEYDQKKASGEIKKKAGRNKGKRNAAPAAGKQSARKRTAVTPKSDEDASGGEDGLEHRGGPHDDFMMPGVHLASNLNDLEMRGPFITIPPRPRRSTRTDSPLLDIDSNDEFDQLEW